MEVKRISRFKWKYFVSGAIAGIFSTFIFTIIHHLLISDIWFSFIVMAIAGMICGSCVSLTYGLIFEIPSIKTWILFNSIFLAMFFLLGLASVLYFDPITTVSVLLETNERPDQLINQALPMTIVFTILFTIIIGLFYTRRLMDYLAILITCVIVMSVLGLNVSIIGLVAFPSSSFYLIIELFILIFVIISVYATGFVVLERKNL